MKKYLIEWKEVGVGKDATKGTNKIEASNKKEALEFFQISMQDFAPIKIEYTIGVI